MQYRKIKSFEDIEAFERWERIKEMIEKDRRNQHFEQAFLPMIAFSLFLICIVHCAIEIYKNLKQ